MTSYPLLSTRHSALSTHFATALCDIGGFEPNPILAVAVSGGSDSMALTLLADQWAHGHNGRIIALTVDHGLRPESAQEAKTIRSWCDAKHIEHHTLPWHPPELNSAIQEKARHARYGLLTGFCRKHDIRHLLLGHHANDQLETLLFRLYRGSGLAGLSCMLPCSERNGIRLVRPLLSFSKHDLTDYLNNQHHPFLHDPSNDRLDYTRNYLRSLIADPSLATRSVAICAFFARFREALSQRRDHFLDEHAAISSHSASVPLSVFQETPPVIVELAVAKLLERIGRQTQPPRTAELTRLARALHGPDFAKRTLAHCVIDYLPKTGLVQFTKENG